MTRIVVSKRIPSSVERTEQHLRCYIENRRDAHGAVVLPMRVEMPKALADDLSLAHDVVVSVRSGKDASGLNRTLLVEWNPAGGGPYPHFKGMLNVLGDPDPNVSHLEIDGSYQAPVGEFGQLFDAVVGARIARASMSDLLGRLAEEIELSLNV